jgi:hypothetical protein
MIDQNSQFMAILTAVGEAKQANADALGIPWTFSQMGVGDANGTDPVPDRLQIKLINERNRAPLNQVKVDPKNSNLIIAEQEITVTIVKTDFTNPPTADSFRDHLLGNEQIAVVFGKTSEEVDAAWRYAMS